MLDKKIIIWNCWQNIVIIRVFWNFLRRSLSKNSKCKINWLYVESAYQKSFFKTKVWKLSWDKLSKFINMWKILKKAWVTSSSHLNALHLLFKTRYFAMCPSNYFNHKAAPNPLHIQRANKLGAIGVHIFEFYKCAINCIRRIMMGSIPFWCCI